MAKKKSKKISGVINQNPFLDLSSLLSLPCHVFWKSLEGVYQGYNNYGAVSLGYHNSEEIIGKTDLEIFPKDFALIYQLNDNHVMTNQVPVFACEEGELKNHFPIIFHSYKIPLYTQGKEIIGVLGLSFTTPAFKEGGVIIPAENFSPTELAKRINQQPPNFQPNKVVLSQREKMCIQSLSQGLTMKEIAVRLNLSPRTVETYIERVKEKLKCKNKTELIFAFMKYLSNQ